MRHALVIASMSVASVLTAPLFAEVVPTRSATTVATTGASAERLTATVAAVQGLVQVRDHDGDAWRKAKVGDVVTEDAEFRTGPKSAVQIKIPPDQTITLDRLGTVKLVQAIESNGKIITNVGMKYGRTRYDIEAAGREHEASISSPSSTLAVRGTKFSMYDQPPFVPQGVSLEGRVRYKDGKKQLFFGNKGQGKTKVTGDQDSPAAVDLAAAVLDPTSALARSSSETQLVDTLLSRGSTVFFDRNAGIDVVTGGFPPTDAELIPALPGQLNFVLRWNTPADLNFSVGAPDGKNGPGEVLYPIAGLNETRTGGHMDFDHRGGPNGGIEIAYWNGKAPDGLYGLGIILASGPQTTATVDAFLGGQRIDIFDGTSLVSTVTVDVLPPQAGIGEGTAAGIVGLNTPIPGVNSSPTPDNFDTTPPPLVTTSTASNTQKSTLVRGGSKVTKATKQAQQPNFIARSPAKSPRR
jgi:hypothetical protein